MFGGWWQMNTLCDQRVGLLVYPLADTAYIKGAHTSLKNPHQKLRCIYIA